MRATVSLARLLRDTGRGDEARAMLAEIYNWFTEGFGTADLGEAKALSRSSFTQMPNNIFSETRVRAGTVQQRE